MANPTRLPGDLIVPGAISAQVYQGLSRAHLLQQDLVEYPIRATDWRTWDALATNLPGTPASDDLGVFTGTFGTDFPHVWAGDQKNNAGLNNRRAALLFRLPPEYVAGQTVRLRFFAGMKTTVASAAATLDVEVYASAGTGVPTGSPTDLCQTAVQSINSTTEANKDFEIDASALAPGNELIVRLTIGVNDTATGTAVDAWVPAAWFLLDIK